MAITTLFLVSCLSASSQTTYYYKLQRSIIEGVSSTEVNGGQFISFIGNVCYESDLQGRGVGHGTLQYKGEYSKNGIIFYWGESYYGEDTSFRFNGDKTILNITSPTGDTYVYKQSNPPKGVTTCSLIREHTNRDNLEPHYLDSPTYIPLQQTNSVVVSDNEKSAKTKEVRYKEKCQNCNGKGTVAHTSYVPTFGQNLPDKWCSECGKYYSASAAHSHITCRYCHGTGEVDKVRYELVYE